MKQTPFRRSMIGVQTMGGVEYPLAVGNLTLAMMMVLGGHLWGWILVALGIHAFLRQIYRGDPDMRRVYARYARQGHRYDPWGREALDTVGKLRNSRPPGFGR
ncbi:type IV secretory pathway, VirB3-like protein [bacterium BMS3Bbin13]|nr:type IV secretory pathway, VirB3-like protein [bacterium BMS3Bbin13]